MHPQKLMLLAVIALVAVGIAVQLTTETPDSGSSSTPDKLFPQLMDQLNDVDKIKVSTSTEQFTVQFAQGKWGLVNKQGYPVKEENVRNVLLGMGSLTILEPKTKKPENYATLGVQDVTFKDSDSALISLQQDDTELASLIVGYDRIARSDSSLRELYVRKPEDAQSWAVEGLLKLEKQAKDWLEKEIISIDSTRIKEAVISENGLEVLRIFKNDPSANDYQLADLPENATISSSYSVNQIAGFLSNVTMDDVTVSDNLDADMGREIMFTAYDGLHVTAQMVKQDDQYYAKFTAAYVEPEVIEDDDTKVQKSPQEVQQEAAKLNEKLADWVYILPRYKANYLFKQPSDLYKIEEAEQTTDDEPPVFSLEDVLKNPPVMQDALGNENTVTE